MQRNSMDTMALFNIQNLFEPTLVFFCYTDLSDLSLHYKKIRSILLIKISFLLEFSIPLRLKYASF